MSSRWTQSALVPVLAPILLFVAAVAYGQGQVREDIWVTDGAVKATAALGNTIYIGGEFSQVGPAVGGAVALDPTTGEAVLPYPRVNGGVLAVEPDGAGGWFLGGIFTHVRGVPRRNLAQIDANGNVTSFDPAPVSDVYSLLQVGGTLYVAGLFNVIAGQPRFGAAAFDIATGMLTSWDALTDGVVHRLLVGNGQIYLGGDFTHVGGQPRGQIAAVDPVSGACLPWTSPVPFGTLLTTHSGIVYIGTGSLLGVSEATGLVVSSTLTNGGVYSAVADPVTGTIYFAGNFLAVNGISRSRMAAIDATTTLTPWNPGTDGDVYTLALNSGAVIVGGSFDSLGGQPRISLGSVDSQNGSATSWNPRPNRSVVSVRVSNGVVFAGGGFTSMNMVPRLNAAAIDASSGSALPWEPDPDQEVSCLAAGSGKIYMGGQFTQVNSQIRTRLAAVDAVTGAVTSWIANMSTSDNGPATMALLGNTLYTGGQFQTIGGVTRRFLAAIDATTGAILPWNPDANAPVNTMWIVLGTDISQPTIIYVGGAFTTVGGVGRSCLAAINASTGALTSWSPNANDVVNRLVIALNPFGAVQTAYIGGSFTTMNGVPRSHVAAVDGFGNLKAWDPNANGNVYALSYAGSRVYVGGGFTTLGGQPIKYLGSVDATTGVPIAWIPDIGDEGSGGAVYTILRFRRTIYVGGFFMSAQGMPSSSFVGLIDGTVTTVEQEAPMPAPSVLRAAPNPFGVSTVARFQLPKSEDADAAIYDVSGRKVRQLHRGFMAAGPQVLPWEGSDDQGQEMPSGIYFLRVRTASVELEAKLHRVR